MKNYATAEDSKFGLLTVLREVEKSASGMRRVLVRCVCGVEKIVQLGNLTSGRIVSCGRCRQLKHGLGKTPIYYCWWRMMSRCYNPKNASYARYGGRGIKVCERWHDVSNFAKDNPGYDPSLQPDRIDNNGNYEPGNVRWITGKENANNREVNRFLTVDGETLTIAQWAEKMGVTRHIIWSRLNSGWTEEDAVKTPSRAYSTQITANGMTKTIPEWAEYLGCKHSTIRNRIKRGMKPELAVTTPVK